MVHLFCLAKRFFKTVKPNHSEKDKQHRSLDLITDPDAPPPFRSLYVGFLDRVDALCLSLKLHYLHDPVKQYIEKGFVCTDKAGKLKANNVCL